MNTGGNFMTPKVKFAVKVDKCPISKYCVFSSKIDCVNVGAGGCPLPIILNPFCTVTDYRNCPRRYFIRKINGETHIFYMCNNCNYRIKHYEKLLKYNDKIITGKELEKLLESAKPNEDTSTSLEEFLMKFAEVVKS